MRDVIAGKLTVPPFSERLADYEADRAAFALVADEYDGIRFQTEYVNKLCKFLRVQCNNETINSLKPSGPVRPRSMRLRLSSNGKRKSMAPSPVSATTPSNQSTPAIR